MCQLAPEIDDKIIVDTVQEYGRRKGIFIKIKEAKLITSQFKKRYGRLPSFKEIWTIADGIIAQKADGKKVTLAVGKVEKAITTKMEEKVKEEKVKVERKKELKKKLKAEKIKEKAKEKVEEVKEIIEEGKCPNCGTENPDDSNFCLQCGSKIK